MIIDAGDWPSIPAAFDACPPNGIVAVTTTTTTTTPIVVPTGKTLWCLGSAKIVADHPGTAVTFQAPSTGQHLLAVARKTMAWKTGETTSIGVALTDIRNATITIGSISGFATGLAFAAGDTPSGVTHNTINLGVLTDNHVGVHVGAATFANDNLIVGGRVILSSSAPAQYPGSAYVLVTNGNNNLFVGTSLEGDRAARSILVRRGAYNRWLSNRFEAPAPIEFDLAYPDCRYNLIDAGYGILGENQDTNNPLDIIGIDGRCNRVVGPFGVTYYGNNSNGAPAAVEVRATSNPSPAEYRARNRHGDVCFETSHDPDGTGVLRLRDTAGVLRALRVAADGAIVVT